MSEDGLAPLLEYLRDERGFDFTGYKRSTLQRRVARRMALVGAETHDEYRAVLEAHTDEFAALFDAMLINVTAFFRDAGPWRYLRQTTIPALLEARADGGPLRVWSAGCASGQEAFSLAMLLAEALGEEEYLRRVKIYATDVDLDALEEARQGTYPLKAAADVPEELAERFLERTDHRVSFRRDLRRTVVFGRNDLVQDAPISRVDLLACRNVFMYFNPETQERVLGRLHFALRDHGYLFLGRSEMLLRHGHLFSPVERKCRVFQKVQKPSGRGPLFVAGDGGRTAGGPPPGDAVLLAEGWSASPLAAILVDAEGTLALASEGARRLFGLRDTDLGRSFSELELSYRPVELLPAIEAARAGRTPTLIPDAEWHHREDGRRRLEVHVQALRHGDEGVGTLLTFRDVTEQRNLQDAVERGRRELEIAYEELQATVEELETTNEELQSTNEELETTNEELQSTNEELETMNEELQSTNEEMQNTNEEMRGRERQLDQANAFLDTVLTALRVGVIGVDGRGRVRAWNRRSEDLWGLRADEVVGEQALDLDIGLPLGELADHLHAASRGEEGSSELELDATNRRGRAVRCRVTLTPLATDGERGAVVLVEEL